MARGGLKLVETGNVDKSKALESAISQIDKAFGKGSLMRLGDREVVDIEAISTGSLGLDIALGIGGLPKGRIVENLRPRKFRQNNIGLTCCRGDPKNWRHRGIC